MSWRGFALFLFKARLGWWMSIVCPQTHLVQCLHQFILPLTQIKIPTGSNCGDGGSIAHTWSVSLSHNHTADETQWCPFLSQAYKHVHKHIGLTHTQLKQSHSYIEKPPLRGEANSPSVHFLKETLTQSWWQVSCITHFFDRTTCTRKNRFFFL